MLPEGFASRYRTLVDDPDAFLAALGRVQRSFRVNTLKAAPEQVRKQFEEYGIALASVPWYADAFTCSDQRISKTLEHALGHMYLQGLSSMLPALAMKEELRRASLVLDACAAPGSKTTQLAALMQNRGTLMANDVDYSRLRALRFNLEKAGVVNAAVTHHDLLRFPAPDGGFNCILLDAPCSAEGTFGKSTEAQERWSERLIAGCATLQKRLIAKAFDLLADNGMLVYATCTFAPDENEAVVQHLLETRDAKIEQIRINGLNASPGVLEWHGRAFDGQLASAIRIWPHLTNMNGFFIAKVRKR